MVPNMNVFAKAILTGILDHPSKRNVISLYELKTREEGLIGEHVWQDYARFIALKILSADFELCRLLPSYQIRKMWKIHLLDTYAYAEFCKDIFPPLGPLIHHDHLDKYYSYEEIKENKNRTTILYQNVFNEHCAFFDGEHQYKVEKLLRYPLPLQINVPSRVTTFPNGYNGTNGHMTNYNENITFDLKIVTPNNYTDHSYGFRVIHIRASPQMTVTEIKKKIQETEGIPCSLQRIFVKEMPADSATLSDFSIDDLKYTLLMIG